MVALCQVLGAADSLSGCCTRPGNVVTASVAPETRAEVRASFHASSARAGSSRRLAGSAFRAAGRGADAMAGATPTRRCCRRAIRSTCSLPPPTSRATSRALRLNSPPQVEESEHRLSIGFRAPPARAGSRACRPARTGARRARDRELSGCLSAAATRRDRHAGRRTRHCIGPGAEPSSRGSCPNMPSAAMLDEVALIDGSVLVNAPFAEAMRRAA